MPEDASQQDIDNDQIANVGKSGEFETTFGEKLERALDLNTWTRGEDWVSQLDHIEQELFEAVAQEKRIRQPIRDLIFPKLQSMPGAPANAGVYEADRKTIERIYQQLLFCGRVEAADGTMARHDTLPLTITQIGVSLVSYSGEQGAWGHRFFRRDLRGRIADPIEEALSILEHREKRKGQGQDDDELSELAGRGIMAYAERSILAAKSKALWRMGHGHPAPREILYGWWANRVEHLRMSLDLIASYVDRKHFVFVPSAPGKRHWLTIGHALRPMEFAIVETIQPEIENLIEKGHYRDGSGARPAMIQFCKDVAPKIVVGIYRVWQGAPPYIFYAHVDDVEMAAHIAMADSILQEHRGFPMLIDLADRVCSSSFGVDSFLGTVQTAYAKTEDPLRYMGERETRTH